MLGTVTVRQQLSSIPSGHSLSYLLPHENLSREMPGAVAAEASTFLKLLKQETGPFGGQVYLTGYSSPAATQATVFLITSSLSTFN